MILHSNIIGEGFPFIILHGFLGMSDNWKTLGKKFSENGFQVHLIDLLFASKYPELVTKLMVADISPRFYPIHHDAILNGLSALDFSELKTRGAADKVLANYVTDMGTRQFLLKNLYWIEKGQLALRINLEVLKENISEVGEALPMHAKFEKSTLFLKGDRSEYISTQDETLIKQHFPIAKIVTIANAGHWLHAENPTEFFNEVMQFVS